MRTNVLDVSSILLLSLVVKLFRTSVWWRKGTLDYRWPRHWPWLLFALSLLVPLAIAALNYSSLPDYHAPMLGFVLTILIWVPLNAAMEQLSWFYVLDAWRNRWQSGVPRWLGLIVGIVLLVILVTLIHLLADLQLVLLAHYAIGPYLI